MTGWKILSVHFLCCCYIHLAEQGKGKSHSGTSQWAYWSPQAEPAWGWPLGHRGRGCGRPRCPDDTAESLPSRCIASWLVPLAGVPRTHSCLSRPLSCKALDFCLGKPMTQYLPKKVVERLDSFRGWDASRCPNACINYYVSVEQKGLKYMYSCNEHHCKHNVLFHWKWRGWPGSTCQEMPSAQRQEPRDSCALPCHWH